MSNEESGLAATRRTPRQGVGGSPVGSWLTIALAVIAVVAGFLILRNINDDSSGATSPGPAEGTDTGGGTGVDGPVVSIVLPDQSTTTTTTTIARVTTGASVLVANANTVGGSAGNMTKTLQLAGYTMLDPVNASGPNVTASIVYFDGAQASAEDIANSVARDLGGVEVLPVPTPAPTVNGNLGDAGVLVFLGDDQAGKTIEELSGSTETEATGTDGAAPPNPSDGEIPVTAPADADAEATDG